ncbi:hypothetical protein [Candidatus Hodarchaeum mangrovi]
MNDEEFENTESLETKVIALEAKIEALQTKLKEREEYFQHQLAKKESELSEKTFAVEKGETELKQISRLYDELKKQLEVFKTGEQSRITTLENQINELKYSLANAELKREGHERKLISLNATIESQTNLIENLKIENKNLLAQISKLQELIQNTENEIELIETEHIEKQNLLEQELKRQAERESQIDITLSREKAGALARDKHLRTVLNESELGKIALYIVDYFTNTKKKVLALETLCMELNITPVITRSHLRNLHGLGVCEFDEIAREIRLMK